MAQFTSCRIRYAIVLTTLTASIATLAPGCAHPGKGTLIGGGGGAAAGGIIGGLAGGSKGALLGAAIGGAAGGAVGNYLDRQANELQEVADTKRTEQGILVNLKNELLFNTGKTDLKPDAVQQLNQLGDILAKYPEDRIRIGGFTDNTGSKQFNEILSKQRAESVRDVLAERGVKENQMSALGYGPTHPVASNSTSKGRATNRRVEVYIDVPQDKAATVPGADKSTQQAGTASR